MAGLGFNPVGKYLGALKQNRALTGMDTDKAAAEALYANLDAEYNSAPLWSNAATARAAQAATEKYQTGTLQNATDRLALDTTTEGNNNAYRLGTLAVSNRGADTAAAAQRALEANQLATTGIASDAQKATALYQQGSLANADRDTAAREQYYRDYNARALEAAELAKEAEKNKNLIAGMTGVGGAALRVALDKDARAGLGSAWDWVGDKTGWWEGTPIGVLPDQEFLSPADSSMFHARGSLLSNKDMYDQSESAWDTNSWYDWTTTT